MNFSPFGGHFPMHQFATAKFSNEQIQAGTMLVTSASDGTIQYIRPEHNGANFIATSSSNNPVQAIPVTISTTVNIPVSSARGPNGQQIHNQQQHALAAMVNQAAGTTKYHHPSGAILSWGDVPVMHHFNDASKNITTINVPYPGQAVNTGTTILTMQPTQATAAPSLWPVRLMQNVSTMTVDESELQPQDLCKAVENCKPKEEKMEVKHEEKESGESEEDSDDSSKSDMEGPSSTSEAEMHKNSVQTLGPIHVIPNGNLECHQIQLQQQGSAMADYLARLPASTIPLSLQHFLKYQTENVAGAGVCIKRENDNISGMLIGGAALAPAPNVDVISTPITPKKKKKKKKCAKKPPRPRPGEIRISTALDGSTLYCCPECHMAYPDHEMLGQHLSGHKLERRFVCNVCGAGLKRKEHLDQHKRGHSDERPFVCSVCLKGFKRNEHLTRHYVIHSGDKSHGCSECGKKFSRKDHLHKHAQTHIAKRVKAELSQAGVESVPHPSPPGPPPPPQGLIMQQIPHHAMVHPLHLHHAMS